MRLQTCVSLSEDSQEVYVIHNVTRLMCFESEHFAISKISFSALFRWNLCTEKLTITQPRFPPACTLTSSKTSLSASSWYGSYRARERVTELFDVGDETATKIDKYDCGRR